MASPGERHLLVDQGLAGGIVLSCKHITGKYRIRSPPIGPVNYGVRNAYSVGDGVREAESRKTESISRQMERFIMTEGFLQQAGQFP